MLAIDYYTDLPHYLVPQVTGLALLIPICAGLMIYLIVSSPKDKKTMEGNATELIERF